MNRKSYNKEVDAFVSKYSKDAMSIYWLTKKFNAERKLKNISNDLSLSKFIELLGKKKTVKVHRFRNQENDFKLIYTFGLKDEYSIIRGIKNSGYYSYYTAMVFHQLTEQLPKTIYLNHEHYSKSNLKEMKQVDIDKVFSSAQRKTSQFYQYKNKKIVITNGRFTNRLGVMEVNTPQTSFSVTDLERTLIDCAVRPAYSGGVFEVKKAFEIAKRILDPIKLQNYLHELQFKYPYEQVIGFYLEQSAYDEKILKLFDQKKEYKFYLNYQINKKEFSERWNLFYPKGFID